MLGFISAAPPVFVFISDSVFVEDIVANILDQRKELVGVLPEEKLNAQIRRKLSRALKGRRIRGMKD